jgi:hypothetical protein
MTDSDDIDILELELDTTWMDSAETCLDDYTPFYKKDVTHLTVVRAYISLEGAVVRVSSNKEVLDAPNTLTVRHMCALAGADRVWKKYLYVVTTDEDAVEDLEDIEDLGDDDNVFREVTDAIQDLAIERTIEHFHDVNALFLLIKDAPMDPTPEELGSAAEVLEIELGSANPLSRKKRRHTHVSFGGAKTRRMH